MVLSALAPAYYENENGWICQIERFAAIGRDAVEGSFSDNPEDLDHS